MSKDVDVNFENSTTNMPHLSKISPYGAIFHCHVQFFKGVLYIDYLPSGSIYLLEPGYLFTYWSNDLQLWDSQNPPETIRIPPPDRDMGSLYGSSKTIKGGPSFGSAWNHLWFLKNLPLPTSSRLQVQTPMMPRLYRWGWDGTESSRFRGGKKGRFLRKKRGGGAENHWNWKLFQQIML